MRLLKAFMRKVALAAAVLVGRNVLGTVMKRNGENSASSANSGTPQPKPGTGGSKKAAANARPGAKSGSAAKSKPAAKPKADSKPKTDAKPKPAGQAKPKSPAKPRNRKPKAAASKPEASSTQAEAKTEDQSAGPGVGSTGS